MVLLLAADYLLSHPISNITKRIQTFLGLSVSLFIKTKLPGTLCICSPVSLEASLLYFLLENGVFFLISSQTLECCSYVSYLSLVFLRSLLTVFDCSFFVTGKPGRTQIGPRYPV